MLGQVNSTDWIGIAGVVAVFIIPVVGGLWRIASTLGGIRQELRDHGRRLEVIETTQLEGQAAGRRRKREIE